MIVPMDQPEKAEWIGSIYVLGTLNEGSSGSRLTWTHVESRYATGGLPQDMVEYAMVLAEHSQAVINQVDLQSGSIRTVRTFDNTDDSMFVIVGLDEEVER